MLKVGASPGPTLVYDRAPLRFFISFSFLVLGFLVARASPGSTLIKDCPPCVAASLVVPVSARKTVVGLPDFFFLGHLSPASCV